MGSNVQAGGPPGLAGAWKLLQLRALCMSLRVPSNCSFWTGLAHPSTLHQAFLGLPTAPPSAMGSKALSESFLIM